MSRDGNKVKSEKTSPYTMLPFVIVILPPTASAGTGWPLPSTDGRGGNSMKHLRHSSVAHQKVEQNRSKRADVKRQRTVMRAVLTSELTHNVPHSK